MNNKVIAVTKQAIVRRMLKFLTPHMHESGYVTNSAACIKAGNKAEHMQVFTCNPDDVLEGIQFSRNLLIHRVLAIQPEGVIEDAFGGGAVTTYWRSVPIEDLLRIEEAMEKAVNEREQR